uniref:Uncharacterized protein n=1 Tax=Anguilla anguilla TaxID=7936 RepID=A0A0E9XKP8_ANGAN
MWQMQKWFTLFTNRSDARATVPFYNLKCKMVFTANFIANARYISSD